MMPIEDINNYMRKCVKCGQTKHLSEFLRREKKCNYCRKTNRTDSLSIMRKNKQICDNNSRVLPYKKEVG